MKKLLPIIIIIALVAVIFCFAACGNNNIDDTITSMSNEMTSIMDDITSEMTTTDMTELTDNSKPDDTTLTTDSIIGDEATEPSK